MRGERVSYDVRIKHMSESVSASREYELQMTHMRRELQEATAELEKLRAERVKFELCVKQLTEEVNVARRSSSSEAELTILRLRREIDEAQERNRLLALKSATAVVHVAPRPITLVSRCFLPFMPSALLDST